jgi:hypothetical protein
MAGAKSAKQFRAFVEAARKFGSTDDATAFDRALKKVASAVNAFGGQHGDGRDEA